MARLTPNDGELLHQAARNAYAAYGESTGGLNFRGEPMPGWADLGDAIQSAWVAASLAVITTLHDQTN